MRVVCELHVNFGTLVVKGKQVNINDHAEWKIKANIIQTVNA